MAEKKVQVKCPNEKCGHTFSATVDLPDPVAVDLSGFEAKLKEKDKGLADAAATLAQYQEFVAHVGAEPEQQVEHIFNCPSCRPFLEKRLAQARNETLQGLSRAEVRELARKAGDWPPPPINFDVAARSRAR